MSGCTFEAVEEVATGQSLPAVVGASSSPEPLALLDADTFDGVASLTDKSLLCQVETPDGDSRTRISHFAALAPALIAA